MKSWLPYTGSSWPLILTVKPSCEATSVPRLSRVTRSLHSVSAPGEAGSTETASSVSFGGGLASSWAIEFGLAIKRQTAAQTAEMTGEQRMTWTFYRKVRLARGLGEGRRRIPE